MLFALVWGCGPEVVKATEIAVESDEAALRIIAPLPSDGAERVVNSTGSFSLIWEYGTDQPDLIVEVQQSFDGSFDAARTIYRGTDTRTFVSGLPNGVNSYRVRAVDDDGAPISEWSPALEIEVRYPALRRVFALMGLGLITLVATIVIIIGGTLKNRRENSEGAPA